MNYIEYMLPGYSNVLQSLFPQEIDLYDAIHNADLYAPAWPSYTMSSSTIVPLYNMPVEAMEYIPILLSPSYKILGRNAKEYFNNQISNLPEHGDKIEANWGVKIKGATDYCARFVRQKVAASTGLNPETTGVYGNAWNMLQNIVNRGGKMIFNIYKSPDFNRNMSVEDLKKNTLSYINSGSINYDLLNVGDVVGIYIPSSSHHLDVLRSGQTYNTHVGVIVGRDSNGELLVEHTIAGKIYRDPISNIRGAARGKAAITAAARPLYKDRYTIKLNEDAESNLVLDERYLNDHILQFMKGMAAGTEAVSLIYPDVPMDIIQKIALAVLKRETGFMTNRVSDLGVLARIQSNAATQLKGEAYKSTNTSKMKLASLTAYERAFLGINSKEDLENPMKAGVAAMYFLAKNYDYLKRLLLTYPDLGITDDDLVSGTILSYNQGMRKLYSLGFDAEHGTAAPYELAALRSLSEKDSYIRDVSSTKYRFLGPVGTMLYNMFEDPHQSYISAALEAMRKYIRTKKHGGVLQHKPNYLNLIP